MNDRDQAREELRVLIAQHSEDRVGALLAHPDLVLRALGMEQVGVWWQDDEFPQGFVVEDYRTGDPRRAVWVEPPTDQESQESRKQG